MHQRVLMSLTEKDVPRLRQLVSVCIRQKRSISYIIEKSKTRQCMGFTVQKGILSLVMMLFPS